LKNKAKAAAVLVSRDRVATSSSENGLVLSLPLQAPDALSSTVVVRLQGAPDIETMPILQDADGSVALRASEAALHGGTVQYESGGDHDNIGYWTDASDWAEWEFKLKSAGQFAVTAETAAEASGSFEISIAGQKLRGESPVTGDYTKFVPIKLGTIDLSAPGRIVLAVHPIKEGWQPMNLRSIRLERMSPIR
jgi:hypothetical protein